MWPIILVNLLCVNGRAPSRVHKDVGTTQGVVRGYLTPPATHFAFLGVPYGRPTRHYRFEAPKPPKAWDGTYEATYRVKCPQPGGEGDENCLVVNIFTPEDAEDLPVLVLVHDGVFQHGWGNFQPPVRLLREFIIVTFNYRVGALGFLCLGTARVPGNAGLKDQIAALYWIQMNIANFGGSPHDVTVYGVGAGAAAVELILISNLSQGLLNKVILESGSALSPLSTVYDPVSLAFDAAADLEYSGGEDTDDLATFFEQIPTNQITKLDRMFLPCIDKNFSDGLFERDITDILKSGKYHRVPMIIVYTDKLFLTDEELESFNNIPESFENLLPNNLDFPTEDNRVKVADFVKSFYFDDEDENDLVKNYIDYFRDITIEYPILRSAVYHASDSSSPVYLMKFMYSSNVESSEVNALDHTLFNYFYATDKLSETEEIVVQRLVTLWSNFIKIGDPTPLTLSLVPVVWPPVQTDKMLRQVDIANVPGLQFGNTVVLRDTLSTQQLVFWDSIYKRFYKQHD